MVFTGERKTRLTSVIKLNSVPAGALMASLALVAIASLMHVIVAVTVPTLHRGNFCHYTIGVTCPARRFRVLETQWELGGVVVKNTLAPTILGVTGSAVLAIFAGMHIRCLVAGYAVGGRKFVNLPGVTTAAGHLGMQTF